MLETPRLRLRQWREDDRDPFYRMNSDPRVMEFFTAPLSREESDAAYDWIQAHFARKGFGLWAAEEAESRELAGFIGLSTPSFMEVVEIGWRLRPEFWGRGLATEGAEAAMRYGFEVVGLNEIVSFTTLSNARSRRVMEKLGMTHDPADDFDHPGIPEGHPLRRHVLYRKTSYLAADERR